MRSRTRQSSPEAFQTLVAPRKPAKHLRSHEPPLIFLQRLDACFPPRLPKDWHQVLLECGAEIPAETLEPGDGYRDPTEASSPKRLQQLLKKTTLSVKQSV